MTADRPLQGKRVLVLEDDYYLASDEKALLEQAGADVVGPFGASFSGDELAGAGAIDAALVDINLGNGPDFAAGRRLAARGIPFLFVTGYDAAVVPDDLAHVPRVEKPIRERALIAAVAALVNGGNDEQA